MMGVPSLPHVVEQGKNGRWVHPHALQNGRRGDGMLRHGRQHVARTRLQLLPRLGHRQPLVDDHQHLFIQRHILAKIVGEVELGAAPLVGVGHHLHPARQVGQIKAALLLELLQNLVRH